MKLMVDFWDVGQGDCSVIHLPSEEQLFIIDVGPPDSMLPRWLDARPELSVHSLVLTHNDADHAGCAMEVLNQHHPRIERFVFVDDRRHGTSPATDELLAFAARLHRQKKIRLVRLEAGEKPLPLYGFDGGSGRQAVIYALYPDAAATVHNLHARAVDQPNDVSGILCLDVNGRTEVIWAGDASMQTVTEVCAERDPLVIVGPHHGAPIKRNQASFAPCFDAPDPKNVFISTATNNKHGHPVKKFIDLHCARSRRVCCTELVHCDNRRVQKKQHVLNNHLSLRMLPPKSASAVTCRGPMQLIWNSVDQEFDFDRFHETHLSLVGNIHRAYCQ